MNMMNTQMICLATALSAVSAAAIDKVAVRQVAEGEQATEASAFGAPSDTGYLIHRGGRVHVARQPGARQCDG